MTRGLVNAFEVWGFENSVSANQSEKNAFELSNNLLIGQSAVSLSSRKHSLWPLNNSHQFWHAPHPLSWINNHAINYSVCFFTDSFERKKHNEISSFLSWLHVLSRLSPIEGLHLVYHKQIDSKKARIPVLKGHCYFRIKALLSWVKKDIFFWGGLLFLQ